jgi:hypothetical protein
MMPKTKVLTERQGVLAHTPKITNKKEKVALRRQPFFKKC